jgi:hypothetical protein
MSKKFSLNDASGIISSISHSLELIPVGSVSQLKQYPADLDFLTVKPLKKVLDWFVKNYAVSKIHKNGSKLIFFDINYNGKKVPVNVWKATSKQLPYMLFSYSYPKSFNLHVRSKAKSMGYKLSQYGLFKGKKLIPIKSFKQFFKFLGIPYRTAAEELLRETKYKHLSGVSALHKIRTLKGGLFGIDLLYPLKKLFKTGANFYRSHFCPTGTRQLKDNDFAYGCHQFTGPGTPIDDPSVRNAKPFNDIDACSKQHDFDYEAAQKAPNEKERAKLIREADIKAVACYSKYPNENGYLVAKSGINGKMALEKVLPILIKSVAPTYSGAKLDKLITRTAIQLLKKRKPIKRRRIIRK